MRKTLQTLVITAALSLSTTAFADALVAVEVRQPSGETIEGRVMLRSADGEREYSCETSNGECEIANVPGGRYSVQFVPNGREAGAERPAMIPPEGRVTLHVAPH